MTDKNFFDQFDGMEPDEAPIVTTRAVTSEHEPEPAPQPKSEDVNFFDQFDEQPKVEKGPLAEELDQRGFLDIAGDVLWGGGARQKMMAERFKVPEGGTEQFEETRGKITEGLADPQQYAETAKGIVPGAVQMVGSSVKGAAALDPVRNMATGINSYMADLERVPQMSEDELGAFVERVSQDTPAVSTAVLQSMSALRSGQATIDDIRKEYPAPSPIEESAPYKAGQAISEFGSTLAPAAPGYEESAGRMLGEGGGSMLVGVGASLLNPAVGAIAFTSAGSGESLERAVQYDKEDRAKGGKGLTEEEILGAGVLGIAPGSTDIAPVELLLGRMRVPEAMRSVLASRIAKIGGQAFIEGFQEGGQQYLQNLIEGTYNPDQEMGEGIVPNTAVGGALGAIAEGGRQILESASGRRSGRVQEAKATTAAKPAPTAAPAPEAISPAPTEETPPTASATATETVSEGVSSAEPPDALKALQDQLLTATEGLDEETVGPKLAAMQRNRKAKTPEAAAKAAASAADNAVRAAKGTAKESLAVDLETIGRDIAAATPAKATRKAAEPRLGKGMAEVAAEQKGGQEAVDRVAGGTATLAEDAKVQPAQKRITFEQELASVKTKAKVAVWAESKGYEVSDKEMDLPAPKLKALVLDKVAPALETVSGVSATQPTETATKTVQTATQPAETVAETRKRLIAKTKAARDNAKDADAYASLDERLTKLAEMPDADVARLAAQEAPKAKAAAPDVVSSYVQRLEDTLGDDTAFRSVFKELSDDTAVDQATAVKIASEFLSPIAKSTSRPKALRHALSRHEKLLESRQASASIGSVEPAKRNALGKRLSQITQEQSGGQEAVDRVAGGAKAKPTGAPAIEQVWGPKWDMLMGQEYAKAEAGSDLSTQYDILTAKLSKASGIEPEMRSAMEQKVRELAQEMGPEGRKLAGIPDDVAAEPAAPASIEAKPDLRSRFYDLLEGKTRKSDWAKELGVSEAELKPLVDEALDNGWLRGQNNSVFRVAKGKRPGRPDGDVSAAVAAPVSKEDIHPETKARRGAQALLRMNRRVVVSEEMVSAVHRAIVPALDIVPANVNVMVLERVEPHSDGKVSAVFRNTKGQLKPILLGRDDLLALRAGYVANLDAILLVRFGEASSLDSRLLEGEVRHELVHVLRRHNMLGEKFWRRLVDRAHALRILQMQSGTFLQMVGNPTWRNSRGLTLEEEYRERYGKRNLTEEGLSELLDQEAVAHFLELVYHNQLSPAEVSDVQDIIDRIESGVYGRAATTLEPGDPVYALAAQATDLSKLGYYSLALRAAKALKQAKGTPEQMLSQLKAAGVKDSEIRATGLDSFFEKKEKSISRDEIISHLAAHAVEVREVTYGGGIFFWKKYASRDEAVAVVKQTSGYDGPVELKQTNDGVFAVERVVRPAGLLRSAQTEHLGMVARDLGRDTWTVTVGDPQRTPVTGSAGPAKWESHALDGSNPSYRESVLHLPAAPAPISLSEYIKRYRQEIPNGRATDEDIRGFYEQGDPLNSQTELNFRSGHWSEPNVISHIRTSLQKDSSGSSVFLIDELQSDWGQKVRDGGERDEEKIAGLKKQIDAAYARREKAMASGTSGQATAEQAAAEYEAAHAEVKRLEAELRTAEAATPSHPLVSTTDQWVGTSLRRILMQAVEAGAEAVSFTPGKIQNQRYSLSDGIGGLSVYPRSDHHDVFILNLSGVRKGRVQVDRNGVVSGGEEDFRAANGKPFSEMVGQEIAAKVLATRTKTDFTGLDLEVGGEGMRATYDYIYPKALAKILAKIDKSIKPDTRKLKSHDGKILKDKSGKDIEFITFPLTEEAKNKIAEGLPLFALGASRPPLDMSPEARKARAEEMGFDTSRVWYHGTTEKFDAFELGKPGASASISRSGLSDTYVTFVDDRRHAKEFGPVGAYYLRGRFLEIDMVPELEGEAARAGLRSAQEYVDSFGSLYTASGLDDRLSAESDKARAAGFDGVILKFGDLNGPGWGDRSRIGGDILAVFSPSNIRSVNAAFDPSLDGENNLLYALGAPLGPRVPRPLSEIIADLTDTAGLTTTQGLEGLTVSVRDARNRLRQILRLKPNSRGMAGEVTGQYNRQGGVARIRTSGDMATISHETAHHLEETLGKALADLKDAHRADLEALASPGGDNLSEGFAEWFSAYIRDPSTARIEAPGFFEAFEEFLDSENPGMLEGFQRIQADYAEHMAADPVARGTANVQTSAPPTMLETAAKAAGDPPKTLDFIGRFLSGGFTDRAHPIRATVKALLKIADANGVKDAEGKRISLKTWENPYKIARMIPGGFKSGHMMIIKGVPDSGTFDVKGPSLQDAVAKAIGSYSKADWNRKALDQFGLYLISRRAIAEHDRYATKVDEIRAQGETLRQATDMRSAATETVARLTAQLEGRQRRLAEAQSLISAVNREFTFADRRISDLASRDTPRARGQVSEASRDRKRYGRQLQQLVAETTALEDEIAQRQDRLDMLSASVDGLNQVIDSTRAAREAAQKRGASRPPTREPRAYYAKIKADLEAQFPQYAEAASMVAEWQHRLLTFEYQSGRWTKEQYDLLSERKDWYVPFMRKMDDLDTEGSAPIKGKSNIKKFQQAKKFKGSDRDIINPIETMMERAYHTGIASMFNDMVKSMADLSERVGPGGSAILERVAKTTEATGTPSLFDQLRQQAVALGMDEFEAQMLIQRFEQDFSDSDLSLVWSPDRIGPGKVLTVPLWENGERNAVRLNDPALAQDVFTAMQGLSHQQLDLAVKLIGVPARTLSRGVTTHPAFFLRNIIRDQWSAFVNTGAWPVVTQIEGLYYELGESRRGADLLRSLGITPPTRASLYQSASGIMGGQMTATMADLKDKIKIEELRKRGWRLANWKQGLNPFSDDNWFQRIAETSETATRLGVFARELRRLKRKDPQISDFDAIREAAFVARDIMDFDRRGSKMHGATHMIAFLNPQIQGLSLFGRRAKAESDRGSALREALRLFLRNETAQLSNDDRKALATTGAAMVIRLSLYTVMLMLVHFWNEDDEEYREINEATAARDQPVKLFGQWYRFPKAFEYGLPANMLMALRDYEKQRDPRLVSRWSDTFMEIVVPPVIPQGYTLYTGLRYNLDQRGRPIENMGQQGLLPWLRYDAYSSQIAIQASKAAHAVGIDVSPEKIDFALTTGGGYWGRDIKNISDRIGGKVPDGYSGEPLIGPLASSLTVDISRSSMSKDEFFIQSSEYGQGLETIANSYAKIADSGANALYTPDDFLARLSPEERAYALLKYKFKGDGKTQRLHPMLRAKKVIDHMLDIQKEMIAKGAVTDNSIKVAKGEPAETIPIAPAHESELRTILGNMVRMEGNNALVAIGHEQWSVRRASDMKDIWTVLGASSPEVADELERRIANDGIEPIVEIDNDGVLATAKEWRSVRDVLLKNQNESLTKNELLLAD